MELGYLVYFLVVFVFGGLLLLGIAAYLVWELLVRRNRPRWSSRTSGSKVWIASLGLLFVGLLSIPSKMIWVTGLGAVPGEYASDGVWGTATLTMNADGSFVERWQFKNEYNDKPEGQGEIRGTWRDAGRDGLTRDLDLQSFKGLAEYERDHTPRSALATVMGYSGSTAIEVDAGADIVFWKR